MGIKIKTENGFVDYYIECSIDTKSFLCKLDKLVDWQPFDAYLAKHLKRGPAAAGQKPYPNLVMFKAILLQFLYNLSDEGLSYALSDRISFIHFIGLPFDSSKPDGSTIGRYRNRLLEKNHYRTLLDLFNKQLEKNGLLVKNGVAVDATLIASNRRPRKAVDLKTIVHDRKEDDINKKDTNKNELKYSVRYSDDKDASWTIKRGIPHYGFKAHGAVDLKHGYILGAHVTGANISDTTELAKVLTESTLQRGAFIEGDKGYASKSNRKYLKDNDFADGIMHKAVRGRKLTLDEKIWNKFISKTRWIVERSFGTLKKIQGFVRSRYIGKNKVEMEFHLHALVHNMRKAINLSI